VWIFYSSSGGDQSWRRQWKGDHIMGNMHALGDAQRQKAAQVRPSASAALPLIRRVTSPMHKRLDDGSVLSCLAREDCSLLDYQRAMLGLALAYRQADAALGVALGSTPSGLPPYTPRLPLIEADLAGLGIACEARSAPLLVPTTWASYLGMRYVVEGASLGAKVIARNLASAPIAAQLPRMPVFWVSSPPWQGCWPLLMHELSGLTSLSEQVQAAKAARSMFRLFIQCLATNKE
jgi:heme oxygenase